MPPELLIPNHWLAEIRALPQTGGVLALWIFGSMAIVGLRFFRAYVCVLAGGVAWIAGVSLARAFAVPTEYAAIPLIALVIVVAWKLARDIMPLLIGFGAACYIGTLVSRDLEVAGFWVGFAVAGIAAAGIAFVAPRFSNAVFFAVVSVIGAIVAVGTVVRAAEGPWAVGGYRDYPIHFLAAGTVLFLASLIIQVFLDPESRDW